MRAACPPRQLSASAIERRSALDTPKGSPPVSDADSIDG
jgi:hypothetical protein